MTPKKAAMKKAPAKKAMKKAPAKKAMKKAPAKKAMKKAPAKKAMKKAPAKKAIGVAPQGYKLNSGGLVLVPQGLATSVVTPASKLRIGMANAQEEIKKSIQQIATMLTMDFEISEIELSISFSADGKFLGFGVGGATTFKIKIKPSDELDGNGD